MEIERTPPPMKKENHLLEVMFYLPLSSYWQDPNHTLASYHAFLICQPNTILLDKSQTTNLNTILLYKLLLSPFWFAIQFYCIQIDTYTILLYCAH